MKTSKSHVAIGKVVQMLQVVGQCSIHELAEESGLTYMTVLGMITTWKRMKIVHVSGWEPDRHGRYKTRLFSLGDHRDTPKPKPKNEPMKVRFAKWKERTDTARLLGALR